MCLLSSLWLGSPHRHTPVVRTAVRLQHKGFLCMQSTNSALQRKESAHNLGRAAGELLTSVSQQPSYLSLFCQIWNEGDSSSRRIRSPLKYRTCGCGTRAFTIHFVSNPSRLVRARTERSWARSTAPRMLPFGETRFGFGLVSGFWYLFELMMGSTATLGTRSSSIHDTSRIQCESCHRCGFNALPGVS